VVVAILLAAIMKFYDFDILDLTVLDCLAMALGPEAFPFT
jgi:hypothetical protein